MPNIQQFQLLKCENLLFKVGNTTITFPSLVSNFEWDYSALPTNYYMESKLDCDSVTFVSFFFLVSLVVFTLI